MIQSMHLAEEQTLSKEGAKIGLAFLLRANCPRLFALSIRPFPLDSGEERLEEVYAST